MECQLAGSPTCHCLSHPCPHPLPAPNCSPSSPETTVPPILWRPGQGGGLGGGEAHSQPLASAPSKHREGREEINFPLVIVSCPLVHLLTHSTALFTNSVLSWSEGSMSECCLPLAGCCHASPSSGAVPVHSFFLSSSSIVMKIIVIIYSLSIFILVMRKLYTERSHGLFRVTELANGRA